MSAGARWRRPVCAVLLWLQAALLVLAVPVVVLLLLWSAWEGGDLASKHRFVDWAPLAVLGQLGAAVLAVVAALAVTRRSADLRTMTRVTAGLVGALAVGWAWVGAPRTPQSTGLTFEVTVWLIWTCPALVAAALVPPTGTAGTHRSVNATP